MKIRTILICALNLVIVTSVPAQLALSKQTILPLYKHVDMREVTGKKLLLIAGKKEIKTADTELWEAIIFDANLEKIKSVPLTDRANTFTCFAENIDDASKRTFIVFGKEKKLEIIELDSVFTVVKRVLINPPSGSSQEGKMFVRRNQLYYVGPSDDKDALVVVYSLLDGLEKFRYEVRNGVYLDQETDNKKIVLLTAHKKKLNYFIFDLDNFSVNESKPIDYPGKGFDVHSAKITADASGKYVVVASFTKYFKDVDSVYFYWAASEKDAKTNLSELDPEHKYIFKSKKIIIDKPVPSAPCVTLYDIHYRNNYLSVFFETGKLSYFSADNITRTNTVSTSRNEVYTPLQPYYMTIDSSGKITSSSKGLLRGGSGGPGELYDYQYANEKLFFISAYASVISENIIDQKKWIKRQSAFPDFEAGICYWGANDSIVGSLKPKILGLSTVLYGKQAVAINSQGYADKLSLFKTGEALYLLFSLQESPVGTLEKCDLYISKFSLN